jgi:Lrp/AsnC family transcriptional regulator, leucine-responsive regulatory protein
MGMNITLDEKDILLLQFLQEDARISNAELARRIDLSPPGLQKRLRRLEETGIVERYVTLVNREAVGYDMLCFVQVTLRRHEPSAISRFRLVVQDMPEVLECYHVTGEFDYLLKVVVRNRKHLEHFLMESLTPVPGMDTIRTSLVLSDIKATTAVQLSSNKDDK